MAAPTDSWVRTGTLQEAYRADLIANGAERWRFDSRWRLPTVTYLRHLRRVEWFSGRSGPVARVRRFVARFRLQRQGLRCGFSIPPHTCAPGLSLPHYGTIVVNTRARLGAGCRLHQGVTIGIADGGAPTIGASVFIGPGAVVLGGIRLGDESVVAANSVVLRDVEAGTTVAGSPAAKVRDTGSARLLHRERESS